MSHAQPNNPQAASGQSQLLTVLLADSLLMAAFSTAFMAASSCTSPAAQSHNSDV
jgi:hypothetical protein